MLIHLPSKYVVVPVAAMPPSMQSRSRLRRPAGVCANIARSGRWTAAGWMREYLDLYPELDVHIWRSDVQPKQGRRPDQTKLNSLSTVTRTDSPAVRISSATDRIASLNDR